MKCLVLYFLKLQFTIRLEKLYKHHVTSISVHVICILYK